jgi:glucuronate isomerase
LSYGAGLAEDRYFDPNPAVRGLALELYGAIAKLPLVCPHGHVDARLFADPAYRFGSPAELLIIPDHYIYRMLYARGVRLEDLGIARRDGAPVEVDPRRIWRRFAEHFYLFAGTPTGLWLRQELAEVFGVTVKLTAETADAVYDQIAVRLSEPEFTPRRLYERFHIEVLCTTDAATDTLADHQAIRASGWGGRIVPTFRPDAALDIAAPGWAAEVGRLAEVSGVEVDGFGSYIQALEQRRAFFKEMGAKATDHAALAPYTTQLSRAEAETIFQRALKGTATADDASQFVGHMLVEMARMSVEDGLVMQLHPGSLRNHHAGHAAAFGPNTGADIPLATEYTSNLRPLLERFGGDPRLTLILFTLDETSYSRELAPLAGFYPALRLGPPWWFFDSWNGMRRYFEQVVETAGVYNLAGFNDDTRAFPSIPARHDLWRRAAAEWLAGLVARGMVDLDDAHRMAAALAVGLAKEAYRL